MHSTLLIITAYYHSPSLSAYRNGMLSSHVHYYYHGHSRFRLPPENPNTQTPPKDDPEESWNMVDRPTDWVHGLLPVSVATVQHSRSESHTMRTPATGHGAVARGHAFLIYIGTI